jgi:hypothetical protein
MKHNGITLPANHDLFSYVLDHNLSELQDHLVDHSNKKSLPCHRYRGLLFLLDSDYIW